METDRTDSRINLLWKPIDWILEILAGLSVLATLSIVIYYYGSLPEIIPRHFNAAGQPDGFSNKAIIWLLPMLTIVLYTALTWLIKVFGNSKFFPKIPFEKLPKYVALITHMIRWVKLMVVVLFAYLTWGTIQVALGRSEHLWSWLLPVMSASFLLLLVWFFLRYWSLNRT